jgi:hypothetical protein
MERLGLTPLVEEAKRLILGTKIRLLEKKRTSKENRATNGAGALRELLDQSFSHAETWERKKSGDVDWRKCKIVNGTRACVGLEIQVSARSELLYKDILHLRTRVVEGNIDLGIIVVPSNRLQSFLPDRTPSISYAKAVIKETGCPFCWLRLNTTVQVLR